MTHICVSKIIIIGSDNGLLPSHYLNQCWNIVNWNIGNKLQWNCNPNQYISIQEMHFKMSSAKWLPPYLSLNVLNGLGMGNNVLWTLEEYRIVLWSEIQHGPMAHSGGRLNIKMSSYQYGDPHVKRQVLSLKWNPHTWERPSLYWHRALILMQELDKTMNSLKLFHIHRQAMEWFCDYFREK